MTETSNSKINQYHFSQIHLKRSTINARKLMALNRGGYGLHQSIWRLFPGSETAQKRDFIYHVIKREKIPAFYVVSKRVPEDPEGIWEVETKTYSPKIIEGLKLGFSMRANPRVTKKNTSSNVKNSPKHDIFMDAKQNYKNNHSGQTPKGADWQNMIQETGSEWLSRQGKRLGFSLQAGFVNSYQRENFKSKGRNIQFGYADFEGILSVQDPEDLQSALFEGVGSSKAFGCGLLLIRRV